MNEPHHTVDLLSQLRRDQSDRWRRGERVLVESYFAWHPELFFDQKLLRNFVYAELMLRKDFEDSLSPEEYRRRFPQFATELRAFFEAGQVWNEEPPSNRAAVQTTVTASAPQTGAETVDDGLDANLTRVSPSGNTNVYMSDDVLLTSRMAQTFLGAPRSFDLRPFTAFEEDVRSSSPPEPGIRQVPGLRKHPASAAEILAAYKGFLGLRGLRTLSDSAAIALATHDGELNLCNVTSLSDVAAEALAKHKGVVLLYGLSSLSQGPGHAKLAEKLTSQGGHDFLSGLTSISDAGAEVLAKYTGSLNLKCVETISDAAAESLATHKGGLDLDSLDSLSDRAAEALSEHEGFLSVNGLTSLSDPAAASLAKHKGDLDLGGVESLSDSAAQALASCKFIILLDALTELSDSPGHISLAEKLRQQLSAHFQCG
jgi:hypothetical protein